MRPRAALTSALLLLLAGAVVVGGHAAYGGRWVRPISDDWAQTATARRRGIGGLMSLYWGHVNGRIANAFFSGLVQTAPHGRQLFPGIVMVLTTVALAVFVLLAGRRGLATCVSVPAALAASGVVVVAEMVREGSDREGHLYQSLYWTPSLVTHTLPAALILLLAAAAAGALSLRPTRGFAVALGALALLATFVATVTEVFTVLTLAVTLIALLARRVHRCRRGRVDLALLAGAGAMVAGGILLAASPGGRVRRHIGPLSSTGLAGAWHGWWPVVDQALVQVWVLGPVAAGMLLGLAVPLPTRDVRAARVLAGWSAAALAVVVVGGGFVTALGDVSGLPSGKSAPLQFARTWGDLMIAAALVGFVACASATVALRQWLTVRGGARARLTGSAAAGAVVLAALTGAAFFCLDVTNSLQLQLAANHRQSLRWDRRDAQIRSQLAAGKRVVSYRTLPFKGLADAFTRSGSPTFVRKYVALYYGADVEPTSPSAG